MQLLSGQNSAPRALAMPTHRPLPSQPSFVSRPALFRCLRFSLTHRALQPPSTRERLGGDRARLSRVRGVTRADHSFLSRSVCGFPSFPGLQPSP
eukprot:4744487-Pleurochrysis_carterae.AAC.1